MPSFTKLFYYLLLSLLLSYHRSEQLRSDTTICSPAFYSGCSFLVGIYSRNDAGDSCLTSQRRSWVIFDVGNWQENPIIWHFQELSLRHWIFQNSEFYESNVLPWNNNGNAVTTVYPTGSALNKGAFVFSIKKRSRRSKSPWAYYANSTATFHPLLEGDLVFKLNPGPSQQLYSLGTSI